MAVAVVALLPYAWGPVYEFPVPAAFTGKQFWNPYASLTGTWQRANLHAHGQAWGGLTNGEQPDADVATHYRNLGYSVAGVSNYMSIAAKQGIDTIPLYEHGFNLGKNHQLAVGAHSVDWFDFPLWQTRSNQQYVINRVHAKADLVALNHPSSRNAYDLAAMRSLTGYSLVEVANGPFTAEDVWDAALSSGRAVWAVANDDTHDLNDARRLGVGWNQINAPGNSTKEIVAALGAGRFYAVLRTGSLEGGGITTLESLTVADSTMTVNLRGMPSTITFISTDGAVRSVVHDTLTAAYTLTANDPYVRTVVTTPQTILYLNPVIRWDGRSLPTPVATMNGLLTWLQRAVAFAALGALVVGVLGGAADQPASAAGQRALDSSVARTACSDGRERPGSGQPTTLETGASTASAG